MCCEVGGAQGAKKGLRLLAVRVPVGKHLVIAQGYLCAGCEVGSVLAIIINACTHS